MKFYSSLFGAVVLTALAGGIGCIGTGNSSDNRQGIASVEISPDKDTLTTGTKLQFRATARFADGNTKDVTSDPDTFWNTSDPALATVSKDGMVSAIKEGLIDISAEYKGEKGNEHFAVTP